MKNGIKVEVQFAQFPVFADFVTFFRSSTNVTPITTVASIKAQLALGKGTNPEFPPLPELSGGGTLAFHESETVEFKQSVVLNEVARYASGFMNGSGGVLYFGMTDSSKVIGVDLELSDEGRCRKNIKEKLSSVWPPVKTTDEHPDGDCDILFIPVQEDRTRKVVIAIRFKPREGFTWTRKPTFYRYDEGKLALVSDEAWLALLQREYVHRRSPHDRKGILTRVCLQGGFIP